MKSAATYRLSSLANDAIPPEVSLDAVVEDVSEARDEARERAKGAVSDFLVSSSFMDRARDASKQLGETL